MRGGEGRAEVIIGEWDACREKGIRGVGKEAISGGGRGEGWSTRGGRVPPEGRGGTGGLLLNQLSGHMRKQN